MVGGKIVLPAAGVLRIANMRGQVVEQRAVAGPLNVELGRHAAGAYVATFEDARLVRTSQTIHVQ
jgi:hypothetical protein